MNKSKWTPSWPSHFRSAAICGLIAGVLWGLLTGAGATPRGALYYDPATNIVTVQRPDVPDPVKISYDAFYQAYETNLIQVTLTYLVLCSIAGWVLWQLVRIRPRSEKQVPLHQGFDIYLIALLAGGLISVVVFRERDFGRWFRVSEVTTAIVITGLIGFILPLFDGIGAFMVWFLRLESVRAPNWETHIPPMRDWVRPLLARLVQRIRFRLKGGK